MAGRHVCEGKPICRGGRKWGSVDMCGFNEFAMRGPNQQRCAGRGFHSAAQDCLNTFTLAGKGIAKLARHGQRQQVVRRHLLTHGTQLDCQAFGLLPQREWTCMCEPRSVRRLEVGATHVEPENGRC